MDRRALLRLVWVLSGAALFAAGFFVVTSGAPTYQVAIGQPVRQDDFLYAVVGVSKARAVGDDAHRAFSRGTFYVTTIQVDNQAMRVGYRWDPSIVYVADAEGNHYSFSLDAQRALDATRPVDPVIDAGRSARFEVAFDLPSGVRQPVLGFSNGILMGDVFNGAAYTRARIPLD